MNLLTSILSLAWVATLQAGPRTSANYTIGTDGIDHGGRRAASAAYTNDASLGGIAGVSTAAVKHGYIGQLYEVTGLALNAATLSLNEGTTLQLAAWQTLDDATFLAVPAASVVWSVESGLLTGVDAGGLASAGLVYQDTAAIAQGSYLGNIGTLSLMVVNVGADDFGIYAGDGLADDWQVQNFGVNNPAAAPLADPDRDGQNNLFEFTAGLAPNNPASVFHEQLAPVPGQPARRRIVFSPRFPDRNYTVQFRLSLTTGAWQALTGTTQTDSGTERTVTDLNAGGAVKFYRVEITKP